MDANYCRCHQENSPHAEKTNDFCREGERKERHYNEGKGEEEHEEYLHSSTPSRESHVR